MDLKYMYMYLFDYSSGWLYLQMSLIFCCSYFENIERICHSSFVPTSVDVLRARVRTSGIIETCFKMDNILIRYLSA